MGWGGWGLSITGHRHMLFLRPWGRGILHRNSTTGERGGKKGVSRSCVFPSSLSRSRGGISRMIPIARVGSQTSVLILANSPAGEPPPTPTPVPPPGPLGKRLSGRMWRACTRAKFSPMKRRRTLQPRPPCCQPGTATLTVIGECVLRSSSLPPSPVSRAPLLSGLSTRWPWLLMQSWAHH